MLPVILSAAKDLWRKRLMRDSRTEVLRGAQDDILGPSIFLCQRSKQLCTKKDWQGREPE